jgi:hypothetical protein
MTTMGGTVGKDGKMHMWNDKDGALCGKKESSTHTDEGWIDCKLCIKKIEKRRINADRT